MQKQRRTAVLTIALVVVLAANAAPSAFKIVAHPSVPVATLSRTAASSAFLKKTEKWPDGTPVVPIDQAHQSALRDVFCRAVHEKSTVMVDAFWQKQVFSGRSTPPITKASDADVIAYVRSVPGAIGYVSAGADTGGVKEIRLQE